jgi:putative spermidine/putrescine transport system ATP-binding protein
VALVGPSGCGKTTTLNLVAGLIPISGGDILIGNRVVNDLDPKDRDIAMVFQNYALYPNKTVYKNLAFPLKMRKLPNADIDRKVQEAAKVLDITHLLERRPRELSGGQQQRVALARSMVMEPKVLLLDEPLSNLDARLRLEMRTELQRVQKETGVTMIFVTHDQAEALALADRIVVMKSGKIEQIGSPEDIYNRPTSSFVADFVGFENIFPLEGGKLKTSGGLIDLSSQPPSAAGLAWRPRMVTLGTGPFRGTVRGTSFAGDSREYLLDTSLGAIKAEVEASQPAHALGAELSFDLPADKAAPLARFA